MSGGRIGVSRMRLGLSWNVNLIFCGSWESYSLVYWDRGKIVVLEEAVFGLLDCLLLSQLSL